MHQRHRARVCTHREHARECTDARTRAGITCGGTRTTRQNHERNSTTRRRALGAREMHRGHRTQVCAHQGRALGCTDVQARAGLTCGGARTVHRGLERKLNGRAVSRRGEPGRRAATGRRGDQAEAGSGHPTDTSASARECTRRAHTRDKGVEQVARLLIRIKAANFDSGAETEPRLQTPQLARRPCTPRTPGPPCKTPATSPTRPLMPNHPTRLKTRWARSPLVPMVCVRTPIPLQA